MSQKDFGLAVGATQDMITNFEKRPPKKPDVAIVAKIAQYAGIDTEDLKNKSLMFEDLDAEWIKANFLAAMNEAEDRGMGEKQTYQQQRHNLKINGTRNGEIEKASEEEGVPIYDVPIDASFIERYRDEYYRPLYHINIPKLRNCNFGAIVSGSSMYPLMKSGSIAMCRIVEDFTYFDPGEMYFISTVNGFETVKYVQPADNPEELLLIPHNDKIKPKTIPIKMIVKMCIVEAWINFR